MKGEKILYIIPSLSIGGAERLVIQQINWLNSNRIDVSLLVLTSDLKLAEELEVDQERIFQIEGNSLSNLSMKAILNSFLSLKKITRIIKEIEPSIILSNLPISHFTLRLTLFFSKSIRQKTRLFQYHHSMQFEANPINTLGKKIFHRFNWYLCKKVDLGHIFISEAVKHHISKYLPIKSELVISNGIELGNPNLEQAKKLVSDHKYEDLWVIPGRLHESKGQMFFIKSTAQVIRNRKILIVLAGGGSETSSLKQAIQEFGLESNYLITGFVKNEVLLGLLELSSLVIIPSISEGFGITAIESLQLGKTILASNAGGLAQIIRDGDNGFQFEQNSQTSLLDKLGYIIDNGRRAYFDPDSLIEEFKKKYTLDDRMRELLELLE